MKGSYTTLVATSFLLAVEPMAACLAGPAPVLMKAPETNPFRPDPTLASNDAGANVSGETNGVNVAHDAGDAKEPCHVVGRLSVTRHSMTTLGIEGDSVLFIGGGTHDDDGLHREVDQYDIDAGVVRPFAPMEKARLGAGAAVLSDGHIVVAGGGEGADLSSLEVYEPRTKRFRLVRSVFPRGVVRPFVIPLSNQDVLVGGGTSVGPFLASQYAFTFNVSNFEKKNLPMMPVMIDPDPGTFDRNGTVWSVVGISLDIDTPGRGVSGPEVCALHYAARSRRWSSECWSDPERDLSLLVFPTMDHKRSDIATSANGDLLRFKNDHWVFWHKYIVRGLERHLVDGMVLGANVLLASDIDSGDVVVCSLSER